MAQLDFADQKSVLKMEVAQDGHIIEYYPKFQCERKFIERYYGAAKRAA